MSLRIVRAKPIEVPLREETGYQLRMADLEPYLHDQVRVLVLVSPNNPTGAVYDPEGLERIVRALAARGIVLIFDDARHFSPASIREARSQMITLGGFSKTFCLAGWRVGFLIAEPHFVEQAIKVQDVMLACAAVISQRAALGGIEHSLGGTGVASQSARRTAPTTGPGPGRDTPPELAVHQRCLLRLRGRGGLHRLPGSNLGFAGESAGGGGAWGLLWREREGVSAPLLWFGGLLGS
jgi:hypothetical protein